MLYCNCDIYLRTATEHTPLTLCEVVPFGDNPAKAGFFVMEELFTKPIRKLNKMLVEREISSKELVGYYLTRIEQLNPSLNAYITIVKDSALKIAEEMDTSGITPTSPLLTGIPVAIKDSFLTYGIRTTAGSAVLKDYIGQYDSTVVKKLKEAGAVVLGKTNLDEFSLGFTTETSAFGTTYNPWNINYLPGGSSGGSAAAVSAGLAPFAVGSEHYDSIRQPAAWCGVVGLKPTYGLVSRYGIVAMASSLECPGPITRTVEDAGIVLSYIAGKDPRDANSVAHDITNIGKSLNTDISNVRIGIPDEYLSESVDEGVLNSVITAIEVIKKLGANITKVELPPVEHTSSIFEILYRVEVSSNLARYDGIRYGSPEHLSNDTEQMYREVRKKFGPLLKYQMMTDLRAISAKDFQQIYDDALKLRTLVTRYFNKLFNTVDVIIGPTSPCLPYEKGFFREGRYHGTKKTDKYKTFVDMSAQLPALCGFPGISIPCGFSEGLPVGLQLFGPLFSEKLLLNVAGAYEKEAGWYRKFPNELL